MSEQSHGGEEIRGADRRPLFVTLVAALVLILALAAATLGVITSLAVQEGPVLELQKALGLWDEGAPPAWQTVVAGLVLAGVLGMVGFGLMRLRDWARTLLTLALVLIGVYYGLGVVFRAAAEIFAGEHIVPVVTLLKISGQSLLRIAGFGAVPLVIIYGLTRWSHRFQQNPGQRLLVDRLVRYVLIATALSAIVIVFLIIAFTGWESLEAVREVGLKTMLTGTVWRPGSIIGTKDAQLGLVPMMVGSVLSTFGAVVLGVPLSILTAILLAEVAPPAIRETVRPAIELLAGIPSVVYGLFGLVVLAPLIAKIKIPYNTGHGLLNASIILAVMIIPTVTNIAEDALRAVPKSYKEGSLALGATHWQTIWSVMLPAARSGLIAAVILGIGRALGETMALIMVIGNSIAIPTPLVKSNPLTIFLSSARTLTGNIAVEINYATGAHRSALFFTGVVLFFMLLLVNSLARYLMRERLSS